MAEICPTKVNYRSLHTAATRRFINIEELLNRKTSCCQSYIILPLGTFRFLSLPSGKLTGFGRRVDFAYFNSVLSSSNVRLDVSVFRESFD